MTSAQPDGEVRAGSQQRASDPCTMVIFGASGDLTQRKLVPALYNLLLDGLLPESFAVVGAARRPLGDEQFKEQLRAGIEGHSRRPLDEEFWKRLSAGISYVAVNNDDPESYRRLGEHLDTVDANRGTEGNRLFYIATPPSAFPVIVQGLGRAGLNHPPRPDAWTRIVLEKPIGRDLGSARELNLLVNEVFPEGDVYRIDHYLGKETVQNLMVFRFANAIFEPLWNRKYVDHVQITVAESIGVEGRGVYYEEAGTTRDMLQNHMFQLLCLIAMEPPASLRPDAIRDEKVKVLQALRPVDPGRVGDVTVRGQYGAGIIDGEKVIGSSNDITVPARGSVIVTGSLKAKGTHKITARLSSGDSDDVVMSEAAILETTEDEMVMENFGGIIALIALILAIIAIIVAVFLGLRKGKDEEKTEAKEAEIRDSLGDDRMRRASSLSGGATSQRPELPTGQPQQKKQEQPALPSPTIAPVSMPEKESKPEPKPAPKASPMQAPPRSDPVQYMAPEN